MELARALMTLPTAPFHEHFVRRAVEGFAGERSVQASTDPAGNLHLLYDGPGSEHPTRTMAGALYPNLILTAHMDHPGLIYGARLAPRDFAFELVGHVEEELVREASVCVFNDDDGPDQTAIKGRITSTLETHPFTATDGRSPTRAACAFKVRVPAADADRLGTGSFAMWDLKPFAKRGRKLRARVCDDLAGVAVALAVIDELVRRREPARLGVLLTRAEETGFGGMMAAAEPESLPRRAPLINIECSSCRAGAPLGDGPVIRVGDRLSIFDPEITSGLVAMAEGHAADSADRFPLRYQRKLMDGGACEATVLSRHGYRVGAVALPLDHYHNTGKKRLRPEVIDLDDALILVELLRRVVTQPGGVAGAIRTAGQQLDSRLANRFEQQRERLFGR